VKTMREGPRDECGVFGLYAPGHEVARLSYFALYALQHRGQESAGKSPRPTAAGTSSRVVSSGWSASVF